MSSEPEKAAGATEAGLSAFALDYGQLHSNGSNGGAPAGHREAQLRARVAELEAQLDGIAACLDQAETRAAEVVALRAELQVVAAGYERRIADIRKTRSWRFTAPLRAWNRYMNRLPGR